MKKRRYRGRPLSARRRPFSRRLAAAPTGAGEGVPQQVELSEEQYKALLAQDIGGLLAALMDAFKISDTPERLNALLDLLVREQMIVRSELMPSMTLIERFQKQDRIGLQVWPRGHQDKAVTFLVYKRWEKVRGMDPQQVFNLAGYLAFLLSPAVRGLVRLAGYDYMFVEPKAHEPEKPKIILVGD